MQLTFELVKNNPQIRNFIEQTQIYMDSLGFTDHGFRHVTIVSDRARSIARKVGMPVREQELAAISGYCHDMGNFLGRTQHHYWAGLLFSQVFMHEIDSPNDVSTVMQAIVSHDKEDLKIVDKVTAVLVLADKSDVHRSRVKQTKKNNLKTDIHDRVNYAVIDNDLIVDAKKKFIKLKMKLDTKFSPLLEYFEIFTGRMAYCRSAAEYLGYSFRLEINDTELL